MPWVRAFLSHRKGNVDRKGAEEGDALSPVPYMRTMRVKHLAPFILKSHPRSNPNQQPKVDKFGGLSSGVPYYHLFMYCTRMQGEKMQAVCETLLETRRSKP